MTTIYHISDWHQRGEGFGRFLDSAIRAEQLEEPDLVIITGDMIHNFSPFHRRISDGGKYEGNRQREHYTILIDELCAVWPGVDILAVRGNHDWCSYGDSRVLCSFPFLGGEAFKWNGLNVFGFRGVPDFYGHWNDELSEQALGAICESVPKDTDILITHAPPYGILDDVNEAKEFNSRMMWSEDPQCPPIVLTPKNIGSTAIRALVDGMPSLKAHFFGHVHEQGGRVEVRGNTIFSNASLSLNKVVLS